MEISFAKVHIYFQFARSLREKNPYTKGNNPYLFRYKRKKVLLHFEKKINLKNTILLFKSQGSITVYRLQFTVYSLPFTVYRFLRSVGAQASKLGVPFKILLPSAFREFVNVCVDYRYCCNIDDIANAGVEVREVDRLVKTHLYRAYHLCLR